MELEHAVIMRPSDFDQLLSVMIDKAVERIVKVRTAEPPLDKQGAAKYLKITTSTLDRRIREKDLPVTLIHRNGGGVYFFASELEQHLKKSK